MGIRLAAMTGWAMVDIVMMKFEKVFAVSIIADLLSRCRKSCQSRMQISGASRRDLA
jgi:hypothetical protein